MTQRERRTFGVKASIYWVIAYALRHSPVLSVLALLLCLADAMMLALSTIGIDWLLEGLGPDNSDERTISGRLLVYLGIVVGSIILNSVDNIVNMMHLRSLVEAGRRDLMTVSREARLADIDDPVWREQLERAQSNLIDAFEAGRTLVTLVAYYVPYLVVMAAYLWSVTAWYVLMLPLAAVPALLAQFQELRGAEDYEQLLARPRHIRGLMVQSLLQPNANYELRAVGGLRQFFGLGARLSAELREVHVAREQKSLLRQSISSIVQGLIFVATAGLLLSRVLIGEVSVPAFAASLAAIGILFELVAEMFGLRGGELARDLKRAEQVSSLLAPTLTRLPRGGGFRQLDRVSYTYPGDDTPAVENFSLALEPGEVVGLVGPNGSGKSTVIKLLLGLIEPDTGTCSQSVERATVLFQKFVQFRAPLSDNVSISDPARDFDLNQWTQNIQDADRRLIGVDDFLGPQVEGGHELSLGQWQRVAIARMLHRNAELHIYDEPSSSLDARSRAMLIEEIEQAATSGTSVLLVTHDQELLDVCRRVVSLAPAGQAAS